MNQPTCVKCKRFLSRTLKCMFCKTDNSTCVSRAVSTGLSTSPRMGSTSAHARVSATPPSQSSFKSCGTVEQQVTRRSTSSDSASLSDVMSALSSLLATVTALDTRMAGLEARLGLVSRICPCRLLLGLLATWLRIHFHRLYRPPPALARSDYPSLARLWLLRPLGSSVVGSSEWSMSTPALCCRISPQLKILWPFIGPMSLPLRRLGCVPRLTLL